MMTFKGGYRRRMDFSREAVKQLRAIDEKIRVAEGMMGQLPRRVHGFEVGHGAFPSGPTPLDKEIIR